MGVTGGTLTSSPLVPLNRKESGPGPGTAQKARAAASGATGNSGTECAGGGEELRNVSSK